MSLLIIELMILIWRLLQLFKRSCLYSISFLVSLFSDFEGAFCISHGSEAISVPHLWQISEPKLTTQETFDVTWAAEDSRTSGMLPVHSVWRDFSKWTQSYWTCSDRTFIAQWEWMYIPALSCRQGNLL